VALHVPGRARLWLDGGVIVLSTLFLMLPILATLFRGLAGLTDLPAAVWPAALRSVVLALITVAVSVPAAMILALSVARRDWGQTWIEVCVVLPLAASGLVLGTGLFVILRPVISPSEAALPVTVLANVTLSLPYLYRLILPEARSLIADYGRLTDSLGLTGWARMRWVVLPRLARPLGFGAGIAAALSMGDLGVIALFAGEADATLPLVVQRLMGAYRVEAAASASLVLVVLSFALFWIFDQGGRRAAA
jgi:thiamine transport system permease protein